MALLSTDGIITPNQRATISLCLVYEIHYISYISGLPVADDGHLKFNRQFGILLVRTDLLAPMLCMQYLPVSLVLYRTNASYQQWLGVQKTGCKISRQLSYRAFWKRDPCVSRISRQRQIFTKCNFLWFFKTYCTFISIICSKSWLLAQHVPPCHFMDLGDGGSLFYAHLFGLHFDNWVTQLIFISYYKLWHHRYFSVFNSRGCVNRIQGYYHKSSRCNLIAHAWVLHKYD